MILNRIPACLLMIVCLNSLSGWSAGADTITDRHLFELDQLVFGKKDGKTKRQWEQEFIAVGREYEKNPSAYVESVLKWLELREPNQGFSYYSSSYMYNSNQWSYDYFINYPDEVASKEQLEEAYLFNHIDRSGTNITRLWGFLGPFVEAGIAPYMIKGKKERIYVLNLISAWQCISAKPDYGKKLDVAYDVVIAGYLGSPESATQLEALGCEELTARLERVDYSRPSWFYSFWMRRHHEGNAEAIYAILNDLIRN